jgi:competence protein ComFC
MNNIKYAGKSLDFRLKNKKEFIYNGLRGIDVILVDDIYTTGSTINQAIEVLKENDVNILFSIVLARKG